MSQDIELWTHEKSGRQYLIPKSLKLPPGAYQITNRDRETMGVQKAHIKGFRAKESEIEAFMQAEIQEALTQVGEVFKGLFDLGKNAMDKMSLTDLLDQFINDDDDSDDDSEDSSWDSETDDSEDSSDDSEDDSDFPDNVFVFEGPSEDDDDSDSDFDLDDLGEEFDSLFKEFVDGIKEPFNELKQSVVSGMSDLQEAFGELGNELKGAVNSEEGRNLLRELGQQLQKMADDYEQDDGGVSDDDSESASNVNLKVVDEEDSVEVIEPEEWVEQLVEEIKSDVDSEAKAKPQPEEPSVAATIPSKTALNRLKKSELLALAESMGLTLGSKATKADIIAAINAAR